MSLVLHEDLAAESAAPEPPPGGAPAMTRLAKLAAERGGGGGGLDDDAVQSMDLVTTPPWSSPRAGAAAPLSSRTDLISAPSNGGAHARTRRASLERSGGARDVVDDAPQCLDTATPPWPSRRAEMTDDGVAPS